MSDDTPRDEQRRRLAQIAAIQEAMRQQVRTLQILIARLDERRKQERGEDGFDG